MLATMLYGKRFFPYYTYNILCGIDDEGAWHCVGVAFILDTVAHV
jgi:20S proteasome alpha/beta subunit